MPRLGLSSDVVADVPGTSINPPSGSPPRAAALEATERWFVSRGIPHFIDDYSASRDVFTRTAPLLSLVFVAEVLGALNVDWPIWVNVLAGLGGVGVLVAGLAGSNALRGRPALARPESIGVPDLLVFVLVPPLLPLVFGGQVRSAELTAGGNLLFVALIYVGTSYGVVPMTRWGLGRLVRQVGDLFNLVVRALPLLLLFVTFLFINAEVWQVSAGLTGSFFWATVGLFVLLGTVFIVTRLPREIGVLADFDGPNVVRELTAATPAVALVDEDLAPAPPLTKREWANVGLVVMFSQGLQILLVTLLIGAFFVIFGVLTVTVPVIEAWTLGSAHVLVTFDALGREVHVTEELLRVAGFLAAFSGLYFTVVAVTDQTYREEFYEGIVEEVREVFAVRAAYRCALSRTA